jgi:single-strand selective monofunctional uracil DNA glycosylase
MIPSQIIDALVKDLDGLSFGPPVTHAYNPLVYARTSYDLYLARYGREPKEVVFMGMNPGPWGMAQTGVPFGEVAAVRDWLGIEAPVGRPTDEHPKRPVSGFQCHRSEVSGRRVWGWARSRFGTPERFFARFFIANYCPLLFLEESGRNRTPDKLPVHERLRLLDACDRALRRFIEHLKPRLVVGIGRFAEERARSALGGLGVTIGRVTHPSPANPAANRGWEPLVERELKALGIRL